MKQKDRLPTIRTTLASEDARGPNWPIDSEGKLNLFNLFASVTNNSFEAIKSLLENKNFLRKYFGLMWKGDPSGMKNTPMHVCTNPKMLELLLGDDEKEAFELVNAKNGAGISFLEQALIGLDVSITEVLLQKNLINPEHRSRLNESIFDLATKNKDEKVLNLLRVKFSNHIPDNTIAVIASKSLANYKQQKQ